MTTATLEQSTKILEIFRGVSFAQMQAIIESGALADVRDANYSVFNRREHRNSLGITRLLNCEHSIELEEAESFSGEFFKQSWILYGDGFKRSFLKKSESLNLKRSVFYGTLTRDSDHREVLKALRGKNNAKVNLADIYSLLEKQKEFVEGALQFDGSGNWFFARSVNGKLLPIYVVFRLIGVSTTLSKFWYIEAYEKPQILGCSEGSRIFCRKFVQEISDEEE